MLNGYYSLFYDLGAVFRCTSALDLRANRSTRSIVFIILFLCLTGVVVRARSSFIDRAGGYRKLSEVKDDGRLKYGQFVELLNVIRRRGLISAERWREFDGRWVAEPWNRDLILEELERIIEEYGENRFAKNHSKNTTRA